MSVKNPRLTIHYRSLRASAALQAEIEAQAARLDRFHPQIEHCKVTLDSTGGHHRKGVDYAVHLQIQVPGRRIAVQHAAGQQHDNFHVALRHAFDAARRQLEDDARIRRGDLKPHTLPSAPPAPPEPAPDLASESDED